MVWTLRPGSSPALWGGPTCSRYVTGLTLVTCASGLQFSLASHDHKKALLSIRKNGQEIASIFDQNHKDNHKNSMANQSILMEVKRGDEVTVYAYTGTWLADFRFNHYTQWVGLLLKPSQEEVRWEGYTVHNQL